MDQQKILLTGVTGFLGSHTAIQLLNKGYKVTGTLRNLDRVNSIKEVIGRYTGNLDNLSFAQADLGDDKVWDELTKGMDYVLHVASPFPRELPKHEDDLIIPAKQGTLSILKAAAKNKVKRVVMVSSSSAIQYGKTKEELNRTFSEEDWTDVENLKDTTPYFRSKTIAEKAAWDFIKQDASGMELTTILPGVILGKVLEEDFGTTANIIVKILDKSLPALPKIGFEIVDAESLADLLLKAMVLPQAAGKRYIAAAGYMTFKEIAQLLKQHYPERKIVTKELPNVLARLISIFEVSLRPILLELGVTRKLKIDKAVRELHWKPVPVKNAVIACAESILEQGIVI